MHSKGVGVMQIVEQTDLSWTAANRTIRLHCERCASQLKPTYRGKKSGSWRSLSAEQEQTISLTNFDKRPEQLKMPFPLWSRQAVRQHIELSLGIKLSIRALGNYLARRKSRSKKPTNSALKSSKLGSMSSAPPLKRRPRHGEVRFIGVIGRHWSTAMSGAGAARPWVKHR